jgi:outer membrane immunogenic protein
MVSDDVGIYTAAGYGIDIGAPDEEDFLVGGGVEFAATDDVTVRAQYLRGLPASGDYPKNQFTLGANFHF